MPWKEVQGVSEKKYGVADYQYLRMVTHSNVIFSDYIYIVCLVVYEILTPYVKCNKNYELEKNDGSNSSETINDKFTHKRMLPSKSF